MFADATAIVLAGGHSRRMGRDKAWEDVGGRSMLEQVVRQVSLVCRQVIIVTAQGRHLPPLNMTPQPDLRADIIPDSGPLAGLYTGLLASTSRYNLAVACDMPLLNPRLLSYLLDIAPGWQAVVPVVGERWHTLHAVYASECREIIAEALAAGHRKVAELLPSLKLRQVTAEEMAPLDPNLYSLLNINTQHDLEIARRILSEVS